MSASTNNVYRPLPNPTSIRIIILAPGKPEDADVRCSFIRADLDQDHEQLSSTAKRSKSHTDSMTFWGNFPVNLNVTSDEYARLHPFQRYEALSYVWGDQTNPQHISLQGNDHFPVGSNLYNALRTLRHPQAGRKLWVDALCINQADHEERKSQVALMRRVYQQAEKVVAYLPLSIQDQQNINTLLDRIRTAAKLCQDVRDRGPPTPQQVTASPEPRGALLRAHFKSKPIPKPNPIGFFIEDCGVPPEDDSLWDSWRRLFGSPYFTRVWILQEVSLGKTIEFVLGERSIDGDDLIKIHPDLSQYGRGIEHQSLSSSRHLDLNTGEVYIKAIAGSRIFGRLFLERQAARGIVPGQTLIEKLVDTREYQATDPRDKVYALLGLSIDGTQFVQHVNYEPSESMMQTFIKFAKHFIDQQNGLQVLLQAGLRGDRDEWPSWLPHWDSLDAGAIMDPDARTPAQMWVDSYHQLRVSAVIIDEITHTGGSAIVAAGEAKFWDVWNSLMAPLKLEVVAAGPGISNEHIRKSILEAYSGTLDRVEGDPRLNTRDRSIRQHEFLNELQDLVKRVYELSGETTFSKMRMSPAKYRAFVQNVTAHSTDRRMSLTRAGHLGTVPSRVRLGDVVAVLEGSTEQFVLRPSASDEAGETALGDGLPRYRLVGAGWFFQLDVSHIGLAAAPRRGISIF